MGLHMVGIVWSGFCVRLSVTLFELVCAGDVCRTSLVLSSCLPTVFSFVFLLIGCALESHVQVCFLLLLCLSPRSRNAASVPLSGEFGMGD